MNALASEAGHWYRMDGEPCYTVQSSKGTPRPVTLRDARKMNLVPSVTTITRLLSKPALEHWKQRQLLLAALTLPRLDGESLDAFADRVIADAQAEAKAAAERGTAVHCAIEKLASGGEVPAEYRQHALAVQSACESVGVDITAGKSEHSFAHPLGFGGKVDAHSKDWIVDFKTKQALGDKTGKDCAYTEHACQLAAYAHGLGLVEPRCFNVFIGVADCKVVVHEWDAESIKTGWDVFTRCLEIWQLQTKYKPRKDNE